MIGPDYADVLEIVNGPEDGTEFPIARTPLDIGADPGCGVHVHLDPGVNRFHARVTVVSEGYRIRRLTRGPVYVNGKRAGVIRSRIVRNGGIVQAGNTELALRCAAGGLAGRSIGLPSESDLGWMVRLLFRRGARSLRAVWRTARAITGRFFWWAVLLAIASGVLWLFRPSALYWLWYQLEYWFEFLRYRIFGLLA